MDLARKFYGFNPALFYRGAAVGTTMLNLADTVQTIDYGVIFDIAYKLDITSSSTNDAAAGTGARTLEIYGLDFDGNPLQEIITMNGQTIVQSAKSFWRVFGAKVQTCGTGRKNAGNIYAVKTGTGGTYTTGTPGTLTSAPCAIVSSLMSGYSGVWTVPRGFTYTLDRLVLQSRVIAGRVMVWHANERIIPVKLPYIALDFDVAVAGASPVDTSNSFSPTELEDVYFRAAMTAAAGIVSVAAFFRQTNPSKARY